MAGPFFNQQYILSCHIFWKYDFIIFHLSNKHTFWKFYPYIQRSNKRWLLKKKAMVNFYMWNIIYQNRTSEFLTSGQLFVIYKSLIVSKFKISKSLDFICNWKKWNSHALYCFSRQNNQRFTQDNVWTLLI